MNTITKATGPIVGLDIPAGVGAPLEEVRTPAGSAASRYPGPGPSYAGGVKDMLVSNQVVDPKKIDAAAGLEFSGIQACQGAAQHVHDLEARKAGIEAAIRQVADTVGMLQAESLECDIAGGAGTGTCYFEGTFGS